MNTTSIVSLFELQNQLRFLNTDQLEKTVFVGFDGFVDYIEKAVKEGNSQHKMFFRTIEEFSQRILLARGKSGQIEMVTTGVRFGGNAPILSNTLGKLGISSFCVGSLGVPERHSAFKEMTDKCAVISVLNPGTSHAIEFDDGKMIFSDLKVFDNYDWKHVINEVGKKQLSLVITKSDLLAFVDWANLPNASDIWQGVLNDIIKPSGRKDYLFLFDLCDPTKKSIQDIDEVLDLISSFSPFGRVTLGLNENETLKIWAALNGVPWDDPESEIELLPVRQAGEFVFKSMNIDSLLVHPTDRTILFRPHETLELAGRLVTSPKVLTGGGDNLNAGYCLGLLAGFTFEKCMLLGMAASGAYIQNGLSPDIRQLIDYLTLWIDELPSNTDKPKYVFAHRHE